MTARTPPRTTTRLCHFVLAIYALLVLTSPAIGQPTCTPDWNSFDPPELLAHPGANDAVYASTMWDPDGAGPQQPRLVIGGRFTLVAGVPASSVAVLDAATGQWSALGAGITNPIDVGSVTALASTPAGDLIAGGMFTIAGTASVSNLARWNGTTWSPMGSGVNASVRSLTVFQNGDVAAGGAFSTAGGIPANCIARWNGSTWSAMGSGMSGAAFNTVTALTVVSTGDLIAGGFFVTAGGVTCNNIARWNGATWNTIGSGTDNGVLALTPIAGTGAFAAGGYFSTAGGVACERVARWSGTIWVALPPLTGFGANTVVNALATAPSGQIVAGGTFAIINNGTTYNTAVYHSAFSTTAWLPLSSGASGPVQTLTRISGGDFAVGGHFLQAGGMSVERIARLSIHLGLGSGLFSPMNVGVSNVVDSVAVLTNGDIVIGGQFAAINGRDTRYIAHRTGSQWESIASGMNASVQDITPLPNTEFYAAGYFTTAGGSAARGIARWNGSAWSGPATGLSGGAESMAMLPSGDIILGGIFTTTAGLTANNIARYTPSTQSWATLAGGMTVPAFGSLAVVGVESFAGEVIAGGYFRSPFPGLAKWNGSAWSPVGAAFSTDSIVQCTTTAPNGDLLISGVCNPGGGIRRVCVARWNGSTWAELGSNFGTSPAAALLALSNGDVIAGGSFVSAGGVSANAIARWNGTQWSAMGSGMGGSSSIPGSRVFVYSLALLPNGDILAGGDFTTAGGVTALRIARWGLPASCTACDSIDFNGDGLLPDTQDIADFLTVFAGGPCPNEPFCGDIDFNNDGLLPDVLDIEAFLSVFAGGPCL